MCFKMTYAKIKSASLKLFSDKGFYGTTIKEIAAEAGLKPSSVYSHITSKENVFLDIWKECFENTLKSVESITMKVEKGEESNPEIILYEYFSKIIRHFLNNKNEYLFLKKTICISEYRDILSQNAVKNFVNNQDYIEYFGKFFIELQEKNIIIESDCKDLFIYYVGVIIAYLEEALEYNINLNYEHIDKFWNLFWKGILK